MSTFVPWRKVACSTECYQAHLAFLEYRDIDHDAVKFVKAIQFIGIAFDQLSPAMKAAYTMGAQCLVNDAEADSEAEKDDQSFKKASVKARKK